MLRCPILGFDALLRNTVSMILRFRTAQIHETPVSPRVVRWLPLYRATPVLLWPENNSDDLSTGTPQASLPIPPRPRLNEHNAPPLPDSHQHRSGSLCSGPETAYRRVCDAG